MGSGSIPSEWQAFEAGMAAGTGWVQAEGLSHPGALP